jgi:sigma-E factor negative regulatory protein RseC
MVNNGTSHTGVATRITGNSVFVKFKVSEACGSCRAKHACHGTATSEKEVKAVSDGTISVGDKVQVTINDRLGLLAVLFSFVVPFILVISTILLVFHVKHSEMLAAASSLVVLLPYYLLLYLNRDKINNTFIIYARKA